MLELVICTLASPKIPSPEVSPVRGITQATPSTCHALHPAVLSTFTFFQARLALARISIPATYQIFAGMRTSVLVCQMGAVGLTSRACCEADFDKTMMKKPLESSLWGNVGLPQTRGTWPEEAAVKPSPKLLKDV